MHIQTFQWVMDINADGQMSLWEIWQTVRWVFRIPGSLVVEFLGHYPALANLLNIKASAATGYASLDGLISKVISLFFWLPLLMWTLSLGNKAKPRHDYLDEHANSQPLLLAKPKDYPVLHSHH